MTNEYRWFQNYLRLSKIYKDSGDANIPEKYVTKDGVKLGAWLYRQRSDYKKNVLSRERFEFLNGLKINWETKDVSWDKMYNMLLKYYIENGNSNIVVRYSSSKGYLGSWINNQRKSYKAYKLSKEYIKKLNMVEFEWSIYDTRTLNQEINDDNKDKYNKVMLKRMKHILEDLSYEMDGNITDISKQKQIEEKIIKRMWR